MKIQNRKWDQRQGTKGKPGSLIADNVVIAWPVMLKLIDDNQMGSCRVLDFMCGTGEFCRHLRSGGLRVEGIDLSPALIQTASKRSSRKIRFHVGDKKALREMAGSYDVITALMSFQFLEDFETYIPLFGEMLRERGIIVFAVFNPDFVESCHRENVVFKSLRTVGGTTVARMETKKGVAVDAYVRSKEQYKRLFEKHGFTFLSSRYPPFTPEFVAQYSWQLPSDDAEYLVMALRKN
ncbi:MAG: class I SAM-dependent methyltransferase [Endomicrobiales bacterium]